MIVHMLVFKVLNEYFVTMHLKNNHGQYPLPTGAEEIFEVEGLEDENHEELQARAKAEARKRNIACVIGLDTR